MMAAAWGLGSVSADGREAGVEERPVVGSANCLGVIRARLGSLRGRRCPGSYQVRRGRGHPPCLPGINSPTRQDSPPGGAGSSNSNSSRIRGAGAGAAMAGRVGGRADGLTVVARPQPQRPAWPPASSPRPAPTRPGPARPGPAQPGPTRLFREPRPGGRGGEEEGEGGRGSGRPSQPRG